MKVLRGCRRCMGGALSIVPLESYISCPMQAMYANSGKADDAVMPEPEDLLEIVDISDGYRKINIINIYRNTDCSIFVLQFFVCLSFLY